MPQTQACNGRCKPLKLNAKDRRIKLGRYLSKNIKFCENCGRIKCKLNYCPCCKHRLRTRPKKGLKSKSYMKKIKPKFY